MAKKKERNYLEFVPHRNPALAWKADEDGVVTIDVEHRRIFDRIAQVVFGRPKVSHIKMEKFGSFIWQQIDGRASVYEIGQKVQEQFGKEAEPLYERLVQYFRVLQSNHYIVFKR